jgi:hypothetical protein
MCIEGKTSYGRHYHKFCSWRATISTILNNATAQYFPIATHAADTKQFKFNITCESFKGETLTHFHLLIAMFKFVMVQPWNMGVC